MATDAPEEPKTRNRAKTESYDVWKGGAQGWELVDEDIEVTARGDAERRRLAVSTATLDWPEDQKSGEFATCISGQFVTMTRKRKVEPIDEWV